ncbi:MAG: dTDP-4-dehydrorhamnose reductase [Tannerella sp.]|jgi:dTDP-4-dehydrorhamnose reductase|nr:dTDP-4-dehydrorhamnose reductase [Tannerella sp.]
MIPNKNILVTGANGQLGYSIQKIMPKYNEWTFYLTDVDTLDVGNKRQLTDFVRLNGIGTILNCAAYTAVDKAEDDRERCMRINRDATRNIGEVASAYGINVIHISTDYVFNGSATSPYREDDPTDPQSFYGLSKWEGELALLKVCPDAVIIRTAWLYSEFGSNFVRTMLRLGKERSEIKVVNDQTGTPTYAEDLAAAMMAVAGLQPFVTGIFHFSNEGICTWYDFAVKIMELANLDCRVFPIQTYEYPTRAIRPAYSVLDKKKIKQACNLSIPQWEESLKKCLMNNPNIK